MQKAMRGNGVRLNKAAILGIVAVFGLVFYILYSYWFAGPEILPIKRTMEFNRHPNTWKRQYHEEFVPVPDDLKVVASRLEIKSATLTLDSVKVFYQECKPEGVDSPLQVLFLHGAKFSSQTWNDLGTLKLVAATGHRAVAIDIPGYGKSPSVDVPSVKFLEDVIANLNLGKPIIVSPSMSGRFSIPFLMQNPFKATEKMSGFIPVAPVGTKQYTNDLYHKVEVPTMIVYGQRDQGIGHESLSSLRNIRNSEIFMIEDGGHACYMNYPDEWHRLLYNFLLAMTKFKEPTGIGPFSLHKE